MGERGCILPSWAQGVSPLEQVNMYHPCQLISTTSFQGYPLVPSKRQWVRVDGAQ